MITPRFKRALKRGLKQALAPVLQRYPAAGAPPEPGAWGLEHRPGRGLCLGELELHGLLGEWGSPLHVVDAARLRRNVAHFAGVPPGASAGCEIYYSYKSNPVPGVLALLHQGGVGAEVISAYEWWLARRLGVPPERIIYNGPAKSPESVREAIHAGVELLNFNHQEEIAKVVEIARSLSRRPRVGVRVSTGSGWSAQFGVPIDGGAALAAYEQARASDWLDVVGLHAHRGGMIHGEGELVEFVSSVLAFSDVLRERLGLNLEILDFGGSLGTRTVQHLAARDKRLSQTFQRELPPPPYRERLDIERYVALLVELVEDHYRKRSLPRPRIALEPGRALTGDTQFLLASVVETKRSDGKTYAILDAGINLAESARNEYHQLFPVNRYGEPKDHTHTVVGPICSPGDTLYSAVRLPALQRGDSLAIMDAGAYFVPFATSFSFPQPAVVLIDGGQAKLLRRAERFEDLIAFDVLSDS